MRSRRDIHTVSELTQAVRWLLEQHFPEVWIQGEVSNLSRPSSGHLTSRSGRPGTDPLRAVSESRPAVPRLPAQRPTGAGTGPRQLVRTARRFPDRRRVCGGSRRRRAAAGLRRTAAAAGTEGLFATDRKRSCPLLRRIGVITSPSGAALRDVLSACRRRFPQTAGPALSGCRCKATARRNALPRPSDWHPNVRIATCCCRRAAAARWKTANLQRRNRRPGDCRLRRPLVSGIGLKPTSPSPTSPPICAPHPTAAAELASPTARNGRARPFAGGAAGTRVAAAPQRTAPAAAPTGGAAGTTATATPLARSCATAG